MAEVEGGGLVGKRVEEQWRSDGEERNRERRGREVIYIGRAQRAASGQRTENMVCQIQRFLLLLFFSRKDTSLPEFRRSAW
jgi:hypothetical protein